MRHLLLVSILTVFAPAPQQDSVGTVADALSRGFAGEQSGDANAMLEAARTLEAFGANPAHGEADLAAHWLGEALRRGAKLGLSRPYRGRALGPAYRRGALGAGQSLATDQIFLAGQKAQVVLVPEKSRSLTIRIVASDEKSVCERVAAPRADCNWLPLFTSRVRIQVTNRGDQSARYFLVSN